MATYTQQSVTGSGSVLRRYQDVMVGSRGLGRSLYFELCLWLAPVPGALGLALRKLFWPRLFATCGPATVFGRNIVLRHPHRIRLGARVVLSEGCVLDARNLASTQAIVLGDDVILAPQVFLQAKEADIHIGGRCGLGPQTIVIVTAAGCDVRIGDDVAVGPRCTIVGGGNYSVDRLDVPIWQQDMITGQPAIVEDDVWLGANVTVLGGVRVARGSVVAAGAVVTRDVAPFTITGGVPAKPIRQRAGADALAAAPTDTANAPNS